MIDKKNVLFVQFANTNSLLNAIELELFNKYKDENLYILTCDSSIMSCTINLRNFSGRCNYCREISKLKMKFFGKKYNLKELKLSEYLLSDCSYDMDGKISGHYDLKEMKYDEGLDCGLEVISTLISNLMNANYKYKENETLISEMLNTSVCVYEGMLVCLSSEKINLVVLPNGRTLPRRAVLKACQKESVDCLVYDGGGTRYHVAMNKMLHDKDNMLKLINEKWIENDNYQEKVEVATSFFREQRCNSFLRTQKNGERPPWWSDRVKNICVFTSSDFEYAAIKKTVGTVGCYDSQFDAVNRLAESLLGEAINIHVRLHPNSVNARGKDLFSKGVNLDNVFLIAQKSKIDTYWLIENSDMVIVFGSTVGIEAVYYGKPVILIGDAFYDSSDMFSPETHEELLCLIRGGLIHKSKDSAYKYGYFKKVSGFPVAKSLYFDGREFKNLKVGFLKYLTFKVETLFDLLCRVVSFKFNFYRR